MKQRSRFVKFRYISGTTCSVMIPLPVRLRQLTFVEKSGLNFLPIWAGCTAKSLTGGGLAKRNLLNFHTTVQVT